MIAALGSVAQVVYKLIALFLRPLMRYIFLLARESFKRSTIQIYDGVHDPCTRFDAPCFQ